MNQVERAELTVRKPLADFIETKALPGTGVSSEQFWQGFRRIVDRFGGRIAQLLTTRSDIQTQLNEWHKTNRNQPHCPERYQRFLGKIGYLSEEGPDFEIETEGIDPEISSVPGPQLVVPVTNARFATNAVNARWLSLYDALYGTDVFHPGPSGKDLDVEHAKKVIGWTRQFLDEVFPLAGASHADSLGYSINRGQLEAKLDGKARGLENPDAFVGYMGQVNQPEAVMLRKHGLHLELGFDSSHPVAALDKAGLSDVRIESAITTIMDCEDSISVVDENDKVVAYENWLDALTGELSATVDKGSGPFLRTVADDKEILDPQGQTFFLKGRALLLVRLSALHVYTRMILDGECNAICETLLDAMCTILIGMHDYLGSRKNSKTGSIYVVMPKMHGPEEVALCNELFAEIESSLGLPNYTVKIGIMDEERRTTVNLKECIRAAKKRVAFINTGFLDRTGDEIHSSMEAGPFLRKAEIKLADWLPAYEDWNVEVGLACGLGGRAQIGKGMWAMPDRMKEMLDSKIEHPLAGASTAWVPSPTAAALHATHYFRVDVIARQHRIRSAGQRASLANILQIPLAIGRQWSEEEVQQELQNNLQGILGYVVRWVDLGIGCSKIPDINDIALMEDRATCRISSQHVANWLYHGIVSEEQVWQALRRMAAVVDQQNADEKPYTPMAPGFDGNAFLASAELVFDGRTVPSGYTEFTLFDRRLRQKALGCFQ